MSTVTIRLDEKLKKEADSIVQLYGINLPTAFRMFAAEIVRTKSVPVNLSYHPSPHFGLTGQDYLDFLLEERAMIETGELGSEHELIEA